MKKLPYNYYNLSPTIMEVDEIYHYLDKLIGLANTDEYSSFDICEDFCELIQVRLSDQYEIINPEYSSRIFKWLQHSFPDDDLKHLDTYLTVMINLNLEDKVRCYLEKRIIDGENLELIILIRDAIDEL